MAPGQMCLNMIQGLTPSPEKIYHLTELCKISGVFLTM